MTSPIAVHEAGHAVVLAALTGRPPVAVRATPYRAATTPGPGLTGQALAIALSEAGRAAEVAFGCFDPARSVSDRRESSRAARSLAARTGGRAEDHLADGVRHAARIVRANRAVLARLAGILEARSYLDRAELAQLLEDVTCPSA